MRYIYASALMKEIGLEEADLQYYMPYWRREFQRAYDNIKTNDNFPMQLRRCMDATTRRIAKHNAKNIVETFEGLDSDKSTTPGYYETYYDPNFGSICGSIFSLGISAACGANNSKRWIAPVDHYSAKEKAFDFTFAGAGQTYGIEVDSPTGSGSIKPGSVQITGSRVCFTLRSHGPSRP